VTRQIKRREMQPSTFLLVELSDFFTRMSKKHDNPVGISFLVVPWWNRIVQNWTLLLRKMKNGCEIALSSMFWVG